jgi:hypothetical protein
MKISDRAAIRFCENFYSEILLGKTINESFNNAQGDLAIDKKNCYSCCWYFININFLFVL